jgi:hypothetical protein
MGHSRLGQFMQKGIMRLLLILLAIVLSAVEAANAGSTIVGAGSQTCSAWTNRSKNAVVKGSFENWLVGFISGLNVSGARDMIGGGDFDAIIQWMDKRCLQTPAERIGIAALDLGMELARNAARP